jgi:hypothetical protein
MARQSAPENDALVRAYPFADAVVVVDVGGGRGGFMATILNAHPHVRGILFDQAHVLAQPSHVRDAGLAARCAFVAGDFFIEVPSGGDVYLLKRILPAPSPSSLGLVEGRAVRHSQRVARGARVGDSISGLK